MPLSEGKMDGIHDLGGMHGFGKVEREQNEPPFHSEWEATVRAMQNATRIKGIASIDEFRHAVERMDPGHYLVSSYYEHWFDALERILLEKGILTEAEIDERESYFRQHRDAPARAAIAGPLPEYVKPRRPDGHPFRRESTASPRFQPGDRIVTRNTHPTGHTRLPRYARGKPGVIDRSHGVQVFPDTHAHGLGEQPQPLYSVSFAARDLWGDTAEPNERVYIDLWESYLLPA